MQQEMKTITLLAYFLKKHPSLPHVFISNKKKTGEFLSLAVNVFFKKYIWLFTTEFFFITSKYSIVQSLQ